MLAPSERISYPRRGVPVTARNAILIPKTMVSAGGRSIPEGSLSRLQKELKMPHAVSSLLLTNASYLGFGVCIEDAEKESSSLKQLIFVRQFTAECRVVVRPGPNFQNDGLTSRKATMLMDPLCQ